MELKITTRNVEGVTILDLAGRLVLGEPTSALREHLKTLLNDGQKNVVLNLSAVNYMDSSGLGSLVAGFSTVSAQGGKLKLTNLDGKVHDILRVTKLLTVFEAFPDERAAIASFK